MKGLRDAGIIVEQLAIVKQGDQWMIETYDALGATARLESLACDVPLRRIYHKVSWLD